MGKLHLLIEAHGVEGARALAETQSDRLAVKVAAAVMADEEARLGITHAGFAMTTLPADSSSEDQEPRGRARRLDERLAGGHGHPGRRQDLPDRSRTVPSDQC